MLKKKPEVFSKLGHINLNTSKAGVRYIRTSISAQKTAVFGCLTSALAPTLIALESCSRAQMDRPV